MRNQLASLYLSLLDFIEPLRRRFESLEAVEYLAHRYGWIAPLEESTFDRIRQAISIVETLQRFVEVARPLQDRLDTDPGATLDDGELLQLAEAAAALLVSVAEFNPSSLTELTPPYDRAEFWKSLGDHAIDDLLEEYLRIHQPGFYVVLRLWGAIRFEQTSPGQPFRRPYTRIVVDWDRVLAMVRDPLGALRQAYHWDDPEHPLDHSGALDAIEQALRAARLATRRMVPAIEEEQLFASETERHIQNDVGALRTIFRQAASARDQTIYRFGFEIFPAAKTGETVPSGFLVRPVLEGTAGSSLPLGNDFELRWSVAASAGTSIGIALFPGEADFVGGEAALGTRLELTSTRTEPWYLLGNPRTARIELTGVSASLTVAGSASHPSIELRIATSSEAPGAGCKIVLPLSESDEFITNVVDRSSIEFSFSPEIIWSSDDGFRFNGKPKLDISLPLNIGIGPVTLTNASIAIGAAAEERSPSALECRVGLGIVGRLGPFTATVDRIGLACQVTRRTRADILASSERAPALGGLDVDLRFAPPKGIGLAIDAATISGGGYLFLDADGGQYAGVIQLEFNGLTLQAIGLIATKLPGGERGFSLLVIITASGFTPINVGFGFRLTAVGGLLGLNRTANVDALRAGLRTRALDALLFPADPVADAPRILATLPAVMPARRGQFMAGVIGRFVWGVPTVMTIELGVVIELPNPLRLIILGQFVVRLPHEARVLVQLQMDVLGVIDFDRSTLAIDAILYDSHVLSQELTGEMALRASWGSNPTFLLAVGGFHPSFVPPAEFPRLARAAMTVSRGDSVRLRLEAYLALTSNTAQVGARVDLLVRAGGFSVEGHLGFDALFQFSPFMFIVDIRAGITLKWHGRTLFGVDLELTLSGPSPWHARGRATFKIWRFSKSVSFDRAIGPETPPPPLPAADPLPELIAALSDARNWGAELASSKSSLLTLREQADSRTVLVHPLADVSVRQRIVPLGITIDRFGNTIPSGDRQFTVTVTITTGSLPGVVRPVLDFFAPAQFLDLTDSNKLRRPSFERMEAGVRIDGGVTFGGAQNPALIGEALVDYETVISTPEGTTLDVTPLDVTSDELRDLQAVEAWRTPIRSTGRGKYEAPSLGVGVVTPRYVVASTRDLMPVTLPDLDTDGAPSYTAAAQALWRHEERQPGSRGELQVVTVFVREGASS
jgi:hypothetical protein